MDNQDPQLNIQSKGDIPAVIKSVESTILGVTVRGWIAIILVLAIVIYPFFKIASEVVANLAIAAVSYYFGKSQNK